jgi:hypothetical protein
VCRKRVDRGRGLSDNQPLEEETIVMTPRKSPAARELARAREELLVALAARMPRGSVDPPDALLQSGAHWALRAVIDPAETDAGVSFLVGLVSGFQAAESLPTRRVRRLRAEERMVYAEMAAAASDEGGCRNTTDLDDLPAADGDHHVNYFYGRLAAFDAVLRDFG